MRIVAVFSYYFDVDRLPELNFYSNIHESTVEVIDLTYIYRSKTYPGISRRQINSSRFKVTAFRSIRDAKLYINSFNCVFFLYLSDRFSEFVAWSLFSRKHSIVFDYSISNAIGLINVHKKFRTDLVIRRIYGALFSITLRCLGVNFYISTTSASRRCRKPNVIVDSHPDLYQIYKKEESYFEYSEQKVLFVFQNFLFEDYDFRRCGERSPNFEVYFQSCHELFSAIRNSGLELLVCFHPKTLRDKIPIWIDEFKFRFGVPAWFPGSNTVVVGHFSNVLIAADQAGAPIILLDAESFRESNWIRDQIAAFSGVLHLTPLSIENPQEIVDTCVSKLQNLRLERPLTSPSPFLQLTSKIKSLLNEGVGKTIP